jgi:hypothetical protein
MSRKNFPFLIVCSLILVGLIGTIGYVISQKNEVLNQSQKHFFLTLQAGETKYFPDHKTKINLQQIVLTEQNQVDGLNEARLMVDKNNQKEEIIFKIGGFAGFDIREGSFSAGIVKLTDLKKDQISLEVVLNE